MLVLCRFDRTVGVVMFIEGQDAVLAAMFGCAGQTHQPRDVFLIGIFDVLDARGAFVDPETSTVRDSSRCSILRIDEGIADRWCRSRGYECENRRAAQDRCRSNASSISFRAAGRSLLLEFLRLLRKGAADPVDQAAGQRDARNSAEICFVGCVHLKSFRIAVSTTDELCQTARQDCVKLNDHEPFYVLKLLRKVQTSVQAPGNAKAAVGMRLARMQVNPQTS